MENNSNKNYVGEFIKENRKRLGLSVRELAMKTGLSSTSISNYETGNRFPKLEQINKLASVFGISPQLLMGSINIGALSKENAEPYNFLSFLQYIGFEIEHETSKNGITLFGKPNSICHGHSFFLKFAELVEIEDLVSDFAVNLVFTKGLIRKNVNEIELK